MDLIDRYGFASMVGIAPEIAVRLIAPLMRRRQRRHRGGGRAQLGLEGERIRLERQSHPIRPDDLVFIGTSGADVWNEQLPDAGVAAVAHCVPAAVSF